MTGQHEPLWKPEENQVLRKGTHFLLRMRHPSWCPLCRIKEWNVSYSWQQYHGLQLSLAIVVT